MAFRVYGTQMPLIFGARALKPITDLPAGAKVRVRMRTGKIAVAFVKTADGITEYILLDNGDTWALGPRKAANARIEA